MYRFELRAWSLHRNCVIPQQSDGVQHDNVELFDRSAVFNISELRRKSCSDNYDQFIGRHSANLVLF